MTETCHQTMGQCLRTITSNYGQLDKQPTLKGTIAATNFVCRAIMNTRYEADWQLVCERKQSEINYDNRHENANVFQYDQQLNEK